MDKLAKVIQAFDPFFPIGAYTLSGGMETYAQKGIAKDQCSLLEFLLAQLAVLPYADLGVAAKASLGFGILELDSLAHAMKAPRELREGSMRVASRFMKMAASIFSSIELLEYACHVEKGLCHGHYPVAAGLFIKDSGADAQISLGIYCYSLISSMANHAAKLVPLRQLDAQAPLAKASALIPSAVEKALSVSFDELGASGAGFDLRAMQHESLHSRLYSS
jgi:urease accessory protein